MDSLLCYSQARACDRCLPQKDTPVKQKPHRVMFIVLWHHLFRSVDISKDSTREEGRKVPRQKYIFVEQFTQGYCVGKRISNLTM